MEPENSAGDIREYAILFIEDEHISRRYFERRFASQFRIFTATDAAEGLDILQQRNQEIAVIVTDQRMPGGTGVELLITAKTLYPNIVRMLTTAYVDIGEAARAVNEGFIFRYIEKPWNLDYLNQSLLEGLALFNHRRLLGELALSRGLRLVDLSATLSRHIATPLDTICSALDKVAGLTKKNHKADLQELQSVVESFEDTVRVINAECEKMSAAVTDMQPVLNDDVDIMRVSSSYRVLDCLNAAVASLSYGKVDWTAKISGDTGICGFGCQTMMTKDLRDLLQLLLDNVRERGNAVADIRIILTADKYTNEVSLGFRAESTADKGSRANVDAELEIADTLRLAYNACRSFVRCQSNISEFGGSVKAVSDQDGDLQFRIRLPAGEHTQNRDSQVSGENETERK